MPAIVELLFAELEREAVGTRRILERVPSLYEPTADEKVF
jgi:hypothetical protein